MADRSIRIYLTREQEELMAEADPDTNWAQVFRGACMVELVRQGVIAEVPAMAGGAG